MSWKIKDDAPTAFMFPTAVGKDPSTGVELHQYHTFVQGQVVPDSWPLAPEFEDRFNEGDEHLNRFLERTDSADANPYETKGRPELELEARKRGILDDVVGTGAKGVVVKRDLVEALQRDDRNRDLAVVSEPAPDTGAPPPVPSNVPDDNPFVQT